MPVEKGDKFNIYFATNRRNGGTEEKPNFEDRPHLLGPDFYRVGIAEVEKVSDDLDDGYKVNNYEIKGEGNTDEQDRGSDKLFKEIHEKVRDSKRDVLVYIHGFGNTFESALSRAAQLREHYLVGRPGKDLQHPVVFAFCWPSNGVIIPPWEYFSDRNDARSSGPAMARTMQRFTDFMRRNGNPCNQRIHLVAHSMGNWALRHAVQALLDLNPGRELETVFDNVFLMAADEDDDAFERNSKLKPLLQLARRIHVYHSSDDLSLVISDTTKFNPNRLGYDGPRNLAKIDEKIIAIDCEEVDDSEVLHVNHQYYRRRPEVIADVRYVLAGRRPSNIPNRVEIQSGRHYRIKPAVGKPSPVLTDPEKEKNTSSRRRGRGS